MNLSLCQRSCLYAVVVVWLTLTGTENFSLKDANDNYPSKSDKPKPCTRLKNTITYQQPICVSNGQGGFDGKSEENCKGPFKDTCPEFNEASCEMYTLESGSHKSCCRLKYYAKKSTWMEIYYAMQYDNNTLKGKPVNNIIEIHRFIKKDEYFPNRNQPDFPDSVINSNGDRGLKWIIVNKANISQPTPNVTNLCQEDKLDERCTSTGSIFNYTSENYPKGFEPIRNYIKVSADERNETVSLSFRCITVVDEGVVLPACQVLYTRKASTPGRPDTGFIYLEANIYVNPYYVNKSKEMNLRYAYWSEETPEMRDKIFTGN